MLFFEFKKTGDYNPLAWENFFVLSMKKARNFPSLFGLEVERRIQNVRLGKITNPL